MNKLWELRDRNERLYTKIVYFLSGYYYSANKNKANYSRESLPLLKTIEYCDDGFMDKLRLDLLLDEFINFDLLNLEKYISEFPLNMKKKMLKM